MTDRQNAAQAVGGGVPPLVRRTACDVAILDTPRTHFSEITNEPYAAEGKRLAEMDQRARKGTIGSTYFNWRQSIGDAYYDALDRAAGRLVADNDNSPTSRKAAA